MRFATFIAPLIGAFALWANAGHWAGLAGFILITAPIALVWSVIVIALVIGLPYLLASAWPRSARAWYRGGAPRSAQASARIPAVMRRTVLAADRGRCVFCGSRLNPQIDHGIPWRWGGLTLLPNLFVLCALHNRIKSDYYRERDGDISYRPFDGSSSVSLAAQIFAVECRVRWRLLRWYRAAWALS